MSSRGITAFVLACGLLLTAVQAVTSNAFDFRAFYCAGYAVNAHANPYHAQPLASCERDRTDGYYRAFARTTVLPAPVPGYDLAVFAGLAHLPFAAARLLWGALLVCAIAAAILALSRLGSVSLLVAFAALWISLAFPSLQFGEIIPIAVASIAVAAMCARRGRWHAAAAAAAVSLCEPHLGLPVCAALFVWAPRTRAVLLCAGAALAAIALAAIGVHANVEYFTNVLPAHALSEIASDAQLSLSVVLHYAGVPDGVAVRAGTAWYAAMVLAAIPVARAMAIRTRDDAFLVAFPAALALIGGSFIHVTDLPAALPLAFLAYAYLPRHRALVACAIVCLAVPWWYAALLLHQQMYAVVAMTGAAGLFLGWELRGRGMWTGLATAAAAVALLIGVNHWYVQSSQAYHRAARVAAVSISEEYPQASWARTNARYISTGLPAAWALRVPSWAGLLLVCGLMLADIRVRDVYRVSRRARTERSSGILAPERRAPRRL